MKFRRHHNNKGYSLIKSGKLKEQAKELERKLGIKKDNSEVSVELPVIKILATQQEIKY